MWKQIKDGTQYLGYKRFISVLINKKNHRTGVAIAKGMDFKHQNGSNHIYTKDMQPQPINTCA